MLTDSVKAPLRGATSTTNSDEGTAQTQSAKRYLECILDACLVKCLQLLPAV